MDVKGKMHSTHSVYVDFIISYFRWSILVLAYFLVAVFIFSSNGFAGEKHALLIGVSGYPGLKPELRLNRGVDKDPRRDGPANDVALINNLLLEGQAFQKENITILADGISNTAKPTRKTIMGNLSALEQKASKGDFVFLYFAGHGSQQPVSPRTKSTRERDGLDEIFLPYDVAGWDGSLGTVKNAILDDEIGFAITGIRNKGAFVWVVFDSCHSGTMSRSKEEEESQSRYVDPVNDLGVPSSDIRTVIEDFSSLTKHETVNDINDKKLNTDAGGYVGFFAVQSNQLTKQTMLPRRTKGRKSHGWFSFSLAQVIKQNPGISYRQTAQRILDIYNSKNLFLSMMPHFEGSHSDRNYGVLGNNYRPAKDQWQVARGLSETITYVDAGILHGLSEGEILGLYPKATSKNKDLIGYAKIHQVEAARSLLKMIDHGNKPALSAEKIPWRFWARVEGQVISFKLSVALPDFQALSKHQPPENIDFVKRIISSVQNTPALNLKIDWVLASDDADIRLSVEKGRLWFLPPYELSGFEENKDMLLSVGLTPPSSEDVLAQAKQVVDFLTKIARVINITKIASRSEITGQLGDIEVTLNVYRGKQQPFQASPEDTLSLQLDDKLKINILNKDIENLDATLLFIDSQYGIHPLVSERLHSFDVEQVIIDGQVDETSVGLERFILILTESEPGRQRADFSFLAQSPIDLMRNRKTASLRGDNNSDIEQLLLDAGFMKDTTLRSSPRNANAVLRKTRFVTFNLWITKKS